ncbi:MAG: cysteine hydrolase [bacterium]
MSQEILDRKAFLDALKSKFAINPQKTAIVTVDMHRGHLDPEVATMPAPKDNCANVIANAAKVIRAAREAGMPVIHVIMVKRDIEAERARPFHKAVMEVREHLTPGSTSDLRHHNIEGSIQTEIIPDLLEESDYVIDNKKTLSIFYGTDLDHLLRTLGMDTLIFMGINTNTCVHNACFDATNRRYTVSVVSDAVDSMYGRDLHVFGLENISRTMGWVMDSAEMTAKIEAAAAVSAK